MSDGILSHEELSVAARFIDAIENYAQGNAVDALNGLLISFNVNPIHSAYLTLGWLESLVKSVATYHETDFPGALALLRAASAS